MGGELQLDSCLSTLCEYLHHSTARNDDVFERIRQSARLTRLAAVLVILVLLPTLFYSALEILTLSPSEAFVQDIYRRQLDVVLFSLNQYAWDIAENWANRVSRILSVDRPAQLPHTEPQLKDFLAANRGILALFVADSTSHSLALPAQVEPPATRDVFSPDEFLASLRSQPQKIARLLRLRQTGYRAIEDIPLSDRTGRSLTTLAFAAQASGKTVVLVGLVLDSETFVRDVLGPKMTETARDEFLLTVTAQGARDPLFTTGTAPPGEAPETRSLWLFPDYRLGIRLKGTTIEDLARERFVRNLVLIGVLDLIIIVGAWFVFRGVRRETELARLKSEFVSNVSHELRTPLSLIRMFAETLQLGRIKSEEEKREYYDTLVAETERLTRLVNNILSFARMDSGKKEFRFADINLNDVARDILARYEPHLVSEGFAVEQELAGSLPLIQADAEAVSEALLNLIDNAVKYSAKDRRIRISTGQSDGSVFVEIQDHGIGIPPKDQKKIFEKFYRVSSSSVQQSKGSGLGLTLVQHIMEGHRGSVTVQSQAEKGSTFRLSFPAAPHQRPRRT
jgi:two-component system phosphate regulon sensor histidine kinase PhoR